MRVTYVDATPEKIVVHTPANSTVVVNGTAHAFATAGTMTFERVIQVVKS